MANNDCIPMYEPGRRVSGVATATVTGKTFVKVSASRAHPVGLQPDSTMANNIQVAPQAADLYAFGVAAFDAAIGQLVTVLRGSGYILPVTALGAISAGNAIGVGTGGKAKVWSAGPIVGYAVADAVDGEDAQIALT